LRGLQGVDSVLSTYQESEIYASTSVVRPRRVPFRRHRFVALSVGRLCALASAARDGVSCGFRSVPDNILSRRPLFLRWILHVLGRLRPLQGRLLSSTASAKQKCCETPSQILSACTLVKKTGTILVVTTVRLTTPRQTYIISSAEVFTRQRCRVVVDMSDHRILDCPITPECLSSTDHKRISKS